MNLDELMGPDYGSLGDFLQHAKGAFSNFEVLDCAATGSSVTCTPPVLDTDRDYLILVNDLEGAGNWFSVNNWQNCLATWATKSDTDEGTLSEDSYSVELKDGARFQSWRRGETNVIVTDNQLLHIRSRAATSLARELNLQLKKERVNLFRAIKFGEGYLGRWK